MASANPAHALDYASPFASGQVLNGSYLLGERLGVGGSTEVYSATHVRTGDPYALKILRADRLGWEQRLMREFELLREVADPALVRCHGRDFVEVPHEGQSVRLPFLVLDECRQSLRDYLQRRAEKSPTRVGRAVPVHRLLTMFSPVLQLLDELQKHAMVHRDIATQNLMFTKQGGLQLIDFNLGKMAGQGGLTGNGVGGGSGRFASPEQRASLAEATPAADVYGLGVCMIEAAIGQSIRVYQHDGQINLIALERTLAGEPSPTGPFGPGDRFAIAPALARMLLRAISADPRQRPRPLELLQALELSARQESAGETIVRPGLAAGSPSPRRVAAIKAAAPPASPAAPGAGALSVPEVRAFPAPQGDRRAVWLPRLGWLSAGMIAGGTLLQLL